MILALSIMSVCKGEKGEGLGGGLGKGRRKGMTRKDIKMLFKVRVIRR
jgi:hypothetical protein